MEILIAWIAFSLMAGYIAEKKGRSGPGFFLLSIFLSPLIAIPTALIARENKERLELEAVESGKSKRCPHCAEIVRSEAVICRFCGKELAATASETPATSDRNNRSG